MDFLDPKKQRRHAILLYCGYVFIGIAVLISTLVLVYQANGFGVNGKGELVQNGLVFVSTQPNPAAIYLNDSLNKAQTNSRLSLPAGDYKMRLTRDGYRDWNRDFNVQGGDVQNFDYPFLFPSNVQTTKVADTKERPGIATQSRDRRWLLVQDSATATSFKSYDLNEDRLLAEPLTLPDDIATAADGPESWEAIQWANDNEHVLLKHSYGSGNEYIMVSRTEPGTSVNLNQTLRLQPTKLTLIDNKYDRYHVLVDGQLSTTELGNPTLAALLSDVLDYKSYGSSTVLYATSAPTSAERVNVALLDDGRDYTLRQVAKSNSYPLDIANYGGDQYAVLGASSENAVYVYKNPVQQLRESQVTLPNAERAIRVNGASYISFSPNTRYVTAQNGAQIGMYDVYDKQAFTYTLAQPLDAPQLHTEWMDAHHLTYIAGGKQVVIDYDNQNRQVIMAALPPYGTAFSQDYGYVFSFIADGSGMPQLSRTGLRTTTDL